MVTATAKEGDVSPIGLRGVWLRHEREMNIYRCANHSLKRCWWLGNFLTGSIYFPLGGYARFEGGLAGVSYGTGKGIYGIIRIRINIVGRICM